MSSLAAVALLWRPTIVILGLHAVRRKLPSRGDLPTRASFLRTLALTAVLVSGPQWRGAFHRVLDVFLRAFFAAQGKAKVKQVQQQQDASAKRRDGDKGRVEALRLSLSLGRRQFAWREGLRRALVLAALQLWGGQVNAGGSAKKGSDPNSRAAARAALPEFLIILGVGAAVRKMLRHWLHAPDPIREHRYRIRRRARQRENRDAKAALSAAEDTSTSAGDTSATDGESSSSERGRSQQQKQPQQQSGRFRAPSLSPARERSREREAIRNSMKFLNIGGSRQQLARWIKSELGVWLEPGRRWFESSYARYNLFASCALSFCMMFMFHETPQFYNEGYARFLRVINGAPQPVFNLWRKPNGLIPRSGIEASPATLAHYLWHLKRGTMHCFRLLIVLECVVRPLFRGRIPTWRVPLGSLRSAFWMTFAGSFGLMAGFIKIPNRPYLTTLLRCLWGAAGSFSSIIMDVEGFDNISSILMGQFSHTVLGAIGAYILRLSDKRTALAPLFLVLVPALGEAGIIPKTPLASLLLSPLGVTGGTN